MNTNQTAVEKATQDQESQVINPKKFMCRGKAMTEQPAIWDEVTAYVMEAQNGRPAAARWLYDHFVGKVRSEVRQWFTQHADVDDVVQNVFAKVFRKLHTLQEPRGFLNWLCQIAKRECQNHQDRWVPLPQWTDEKNSWEGHEMNQKEATDPAYITLVSLEWDQFLEALANLPAKRQAAFRLYYLEDMSLKEVAQEMHVPLGSVKSLLFNARQMLQQKLGKPIWELPA